MIPSKQFLQRILLAAGVAVGATTAMAAPGQFEKPLNMAFCVTRRCG